MREWSDEEKLAWNTWELPEFLREHAEHNLNAILQFLHKYGYTVRTDLLNFIVGDGSGRLGASDLLPHLRYNSKVQQHSLGNAIIDALQARPEPHEPQPYAGDAEHKKIEAGIPVVDQPITASSKAEMRRIAEAERQQAMEEIRKAKEKIEEAHAQAECEAMTVVHRTGKGIDAHFVDMLRQSFYKNSDGSIHWRATLSLRKSLCAEYEWRKQNSGLVFTPDAR